MSTHLAEVSWELSGEDFRAGKYSREHIWRFDGGVTLPASPSPQIVREPYSNPAAVDPEEAFVAAIASCHLLTFLYVASRRGVVVTRYVDQAVGSMTKNEQGVPWVSQVVLRPRIEYGESGKPSPELEAELHHAAHAQCFIANSVKTAIVVEAATGKPSDA
jgi:organic hydroperoxide reductase OsmC/OhrA